MSLWKWIICLVCGLFIFMLLYGFGEFVAEIPSLEPWLSIVLYAVAGLLGLFLYAVWTNLTERRPVTELTLKRTFSDLGLGLLIGVLYFGAVAGLMALAGSYRISGARFDWLPLLIWFMHFFVVAVFEEIIFRGILFRMIDDRWNTGVALIISALVFGAVHLSNPGATLWSAFAIAVEAGLLLGAAYKWSGTLWLPIGIHWAWNFVQGDILGFAVSGLPVTNKVFSAIITGPDWITGGRFGAEASVPAVVVGLLVTILFLVGSKNTERK